MAESEEKKKNLPTPDYLEEHKWKISKRLDEFIVIIPIMISKGKKRTRAL